MDHKDDQAAGSRPSDLPRRMPDVGTYCDDDVVQSADGEWQIGDADAYPYLILTIMQCMWEISHNQFFHLPISAFMPTPPTVR